MTRTYHPVPWPYIAAANRDEAAEEIAAALNNTTRLIEIITDPVAIQNIAQAIYHQQNALRHLEAAGAKTRPKPP